MVHYQPQIEKLNVLQANEYQMQRDGPGAAIYKETVTPLRNGWETLETFMELRGGLVFGLENDEMFRPRLELYLDCMFY